jgi:hypothetical protein
MNTHHISWWIIMTKRRVSEAAPVQVYLGREGQERLERLTEQFETTKSEILRRGLLALERELLDPAAHPALRLIGLVSSESDDVDDAARDHDRLLTDSEEASWAPVAKSGKSAPARRRRAR